MFMTLAQQPGHFEDDIDPTLIEYTLSLTPAERLEFHERQSELLFNSPGLKCGAD
jgi:hypothetical protein